MVNYMAVVEALENSKWYCLLANGEDGYMIYRDETYPDFEVVFADWDLPRGGAHIRLIDNRKPYQSSCCVRRDLDGLDDYSVPMAIAEFLEEVRQYLG